MDLGTTLAETGETLDELDGPPRSGRRESVFARGQVVGRYVILHELGTGGMGVVYAAYDPELDRKVALKVMRPDDRAGADRSAGHARLLREAQALARFSHPEIVAIHDVGEHEGSVWLAMEFVDGRTLGTWAAGRPWREVLEVLIGVGRGVAAAHAAGLIHRDLKPDNVMVGLDGRPRVMDFGLIRSQTIEARQSGLRETPRLEALASELTAAGSVVGTPAYMAPEQLLGHEVGPAADQWAYCVTAWQALYGERPFGGRTALEIAANVLEGRRRPAPRTGAPRWLRRALERGLAGDASGRWPSMAALVGVLERGQQRRRRRIGVAGLACVVAVGAGIEGGRQVEHAARVSACEVEADAIDRVWNDEARARVRASFDATGVAGADAAIAKAIPWLDAQAASWRTHRRDVCLRATVDHTLADDLYDRSLWCLDERRLEFGALIDEFGGASATVVHKAVPAAAGLARIESCTDGASLAAAPAPPSLDARPELDPLRAELAAARSRVAAGEYDQARPAVAAVLTRAHELGWAPMIADVLELDGYLADLSGDYARAEQTLRASHLEAGKAGNWETAAAAANRLVYVVGYHLARPDEARLWAEHASVAIAHGADGLDLREAERLNALATVENSAASYDRALTLNAEALSIRERRLGARHPDVAQSLNNLALVHFAKGDLRDSQRVHERALGLRIDALGPDHPDVASSLNNLATIHNLLGDTELAKTTQLRALEVFERAHGPDHPNVAACLNNLGMMHSETGDYPTAKGYYDRALAIRRRSLGDAHPLVAMSYNNLGLVEILMKDLDAARGHCEKAIEIWERALGPEHPDLAMGLANLGNVELDVDRPAAARPLYERALAIREKAFGPDSPKVALALDGLVEVALAEGRNEDALALAQRTMTLREGADVSDARRAWGQFLYARALWARGEDRARAVELARAAAAGLRGEKTGADTLARIDAWLATHDSPSAPAG